MKDRIKRAMDVHLNCLHASYASRSAIMQKAHGGIKVKKKLSLGLTLALTLILAVISALAAVILTHKEFVTQVLSPKASENTSETWTREEMDQILRVASEYGVALDEETLLSLSLANVNYKEETMRLFAKAELGFYPSTWSIDDQAWYDQVLVDSGLSKQRTRFVPEGDEIKEQQALDIALNYIKSNYDANSAVTDTSIYRRHMTYQSYSDNPYNKGKQWYIEYEPLDQIHSHYTLILLSDGTVKEAKRELGLKEEGRPALMANEVLDLYRDTYGDHTVWAMETWIRLQNEVAEAAKINPGAVSNNLRALLKQRYGLPDNTSISKEAAIDAAVKAVASSGGPDEKTLREECLAAAIYLLDDTGPTWKVSFFNQTDSGSRGIHMAEIDARTAEVRHMDISKILDSWIEPYVLHSNLPIALPAQVTPTPRPDGKPKIWYSDIAPAYYWEALDKIGYNAGTASDLMGRWQSEYGTDHMFWPLEAQAIDIIWHEIGQSTPTVLPGLPAQGDIPQEKALDIAWQAFREAKTQMYDTAFIDSLKPAVSFTFNTPSIGDRVWTIEFAEVKPTAISVLEQVTINAITGEIMGSSWGAGPTPAPTATPRPDGKPVMWHSDLAPDYFWQMLDAVSFIGNSAEEYRRQCVQTYGEDSDFWPLTEKAIMNLWYSDPSYSSVVFGLPAPEDMQQDDAVALALKTLLDAYGDSMGEEYFKALKPVVAFHFNSPGMGDRIWFIQFVEATPAENIYSAYVSIDAKTGEILNMTVGRGHG